MTPKQLADCTGCVSVTRAAAWYAPILEAMAAYEINTPLRQAAFLAQIGHESGGMQWPIEIWGPTKSQMKYEGRIDLGNTQPGDGKRFRGHGLLQTTGRFNHRRVRDRLRKKFPALVVPDFEVFPEQLALPEWAALSAADFWDEHHLNRFADVGDLDTISDLINLGRKTMREGDANGYAGRQALYLKAREVLGC